MAKPVRCTDHTGRNFESLSEMLAHWDVPLRTYYHKVSLGLPLTEILEPAQVEDHLGNKYKSVSEMCAAYGIQTNTFFVRKRNGKPLKQCLQGTRRNKRTATIYSEKPPRKATRWTAIEKRDEERYLDRGRLCVPGEVFQACMVKTKLHLLFGYGNQECCYFARDLMRAFEDAPIADECVIDMYWHYTVTVNIKSPKGTLILHTDWKDKNTHLVLVNAYRDIRESLLKKEE